MKKFLLGSLLALLALPAFAGTITGTLNKPNGQPVANGVISFALSQAGSSQLGAITLTSDTVYCGTDTNGVVVGVTNPAVSPVLSSNYGAGTLPGGATYYVQYTYTTATGESGPSPEGVIPFSASGTLGGSSPALKPGNATGYNVYVGTATGAETLQLSITGFAGWSIAAPLGAGASPPSNNTVCASLTFNDAIIPANTVYLVNVITGDGKQVGGYPQRLYLAGSSVDLSTLTPAANTYAKFPTAIIAQPSGHGTQSISGNLDLGAYDLFAHSLHLTGSLSANLFVANARVFCDQSPGGTLDAQLNDCINQVIAQGGGVADASGLIGVQTQVAPVNVGNLGSVPVTLITSPYLIDNITINSAGACAFRVFNESRIMGTIHGITHSGIFRVNGASSMNAAVCTDGTNPEYVSLQGMQIYSPDGATLTKGGVYLYNVFDVTELRDFMVAAYGTIGVHWQAACCGSTMTSTIIDGGHIANSIPLQIDSLAGDPQPVAGLQLVGNSIDHPGTGKSNIVINNTFASSNSGCSVESFGLYMESNNTDTSTPFVSIAGCNRTSWTGTTAQSRAALSTQHVWSLVAGGGGALRPRITVKGFNFFNSTQTYPAPVIDDVNFSALIMSDSIGNLTNWDNRMSWMAGWACPEAANAAGAEAVAEANVAILYCDGTSHTLKVSYNNGSFFNVTQTIGTGTSTSNGTAIASGVSQAQPAITVTGAAVTDVAICALNAAPVATWQTGIQLLPAVVTANTVTPWLSNPSAGSITPAAAVIRCAVTR